jgi:hypothetical protein
MATASYAPVHDINWDFPLWSEILPGLFLGGTDDDDTIEDAANINTPRNITKDNFDTVVTLYAFANILRGLLPVAFVLLLGVEPLPSQDSRQTYAVPLFLLWALHNKLKDRWLWFVLPDRHY